MMPRHMPTFWKAWKPNQQAMPAAATRPNTSSARGGDRQRPPDHHRRAAAISRPAPTRPSSSPATVKTKSVCCSGTKPGPGLGAVEETLAERGRRCRPRSGPARCCSRRPRGSRPGLVKARKRSTWYSSSSPQPHRGPGGGDAAAGEQGQPPPRGPGSGQHAEDGGREHQHRAQVGLEQDQRGREAGDRQHARPRRPEPTARRQPPSARSATTRAIPIDDGELGELRGLDRQPAEAQPGPGAVDRRRPWSAPGRSPTTEPR